MADSDKQQGYQMCGRVRNDCTNNVASPQVIQNGQLRELRKRKTSGPLPPISGGHMIPKEDIFVQGLVASIYENREDMEDAIDDYLQGRGIDVYYIRVFRRESDPEVANCKITVAGEDLESVLETTFWPENVSVREWYHN